MATATAAPTTTATRVAHAGGAALGEGPLYDPRTRTLYYVDIDGCAVWSVGDGGTGDARRVAVAPEKVGCAALTTDPGTLLICTARDVRPVSVRDGAVGEPLATLPESEGPGLPAMRFNDGKASPQGCLVAGRLHSGWRDGHTGAVYVLERQHNPSPTPPSFAWARCLDGDDCAMPNGLAWAERGGRQVCFLVDSARGSVSAYDTAPATGAPVTRTGRVVLGARALGGATPDGLDVDACGRLWVALAETGRVACFDPGSGARLATLDTRPTLTRVTSCGFGGDGLATLFVSSRAESGASASALAGALLAADVGVAGGGERGVVAL